MATIEVRTQFELDAALKKADPNELIACIGTGYFEVHDSSQVTACGSSQVRAYGSSQVTAYDSSQVRACGSSQVRASKFVAVTRSAPTAGVAGGVIIELPRIDSPSAWLDFHGVEVKRGVAILYKALDDDWHASHLLPDGSRPSYAPGSKPKCPEFDAAPRDCGCGFHACASPAQALHYKDNATRFCAIPVRVADLGHPDPNGDTDKIRFRCACKPIYEVDIYGEPVKAAKS